MLLSVPGKVLNRILLEKVKRRKEKQHVPFRTLKLLMAIWRMKLLLTGWLVLYTPSYHEPSD